MSLELCNTGLPEATWLTCVPNNLCFNEKIKVWILFKYLNSNLHELVKKSL